MADALDLDTILRELEALKRRLIEMEADDLAHREAEALAAEISAIRLQLKRLAADREALGAELARSLGLRP